MYYKLNILDKLLIPLLLLLPFFLFSQDMRDDSTGLYLTPEQVITNEDWSKFSELHQSNSTDPQTKIQEIEKLLEKYYSQFVGEKRILEEKINGETFSPGISQNTLRLLVRDMKSQKSQTYLIRDSDMLFEIYETLGDLYKSVQNNPKSVWSYAAALRYRDFTNSEAKLISEFQDKKSGSDALQKHIAIKENYEKAKLELKEAKDSYYLERSKDIRTPNIKFLQQAPNFGAMENKVEKAEKDYQNSLKVNIQPLIDRKGEKDSNVIYKLAEVVKIAEDENQERLKVLDKSNTFWGEPFIL